MKTVGVYDAKNHFSQLLAEVEGGETILLTRNGRPVAQLIPPVADDTKAADAMEWILSRRWSLGGLAIRDLIDEGRRF